MDGYHAPVYQALTKRILIAGVPRDIVIINGTFVAAFVIQLHSVTALVLSVVVHLAARELTKKDEYFFDCLRSYLGQKKYYE